MGGMKAMTDTRKDITVETKENPKKFSSDFDKKLESDKAKFQLEQNIIARDERLRRNMLLGAIIFFWFLAAILTAAIFTFAWHKLAPSCLEFLTSDKIDSIQTFLLSGALTAFLSSVGRNLVSRYTNINN